MSSASSTESQPAPRRWRPFAERTRTKTIATLGPAIGDRERIVELIAEGVDVFRLNLAHGTRRQHQQALDDVRWASARAGDAVGVLVDLAGPKIRLGELFEDPLTCAAGERLVFVRGERARARGELVCSYPQLIDDVQVGDWIMLRDGMVRLTVVRKEDERVECQVVDGGTIRSRQGVNLPGAHLSVQALSDVDRDHAHWAAAAGVDFVSLSFVRQACEIQQLKQLLADAGSAAQVIAKIEKREALEQLEAIVAAADAVMVARGDLGVEIEIEKTPLAQKQIIRTCQAWGKPVIVATQMLESMQESPQPTRAEVSDVANAILDGADACMLSGETAIGRYPRQAVRIMRRVMFETEQMLRHRPPQDWPESDTPLDRISHAIVFGAAHIARRIEARMVVVATSNGDAARLKSKQRDFIPTVAVTDQPHIVRRMSLLWGIFPVLAPVVDQPVALRQLVQQWAAADPLINPGDRVVLVVDTPVLPGIHDLVMVEEIMGD